MAGTAVVVGATGQLGRLAVRRLAEDGWAVTAISRTVRPDVAWPSDLGVQALQLDRHDTSAFASALGSECDVLVDMVAYDAADAQQLLDLSGRIGSAVVISSVNVYVDEHQRGFDTQETAFPQYPVPISEEQPTIEAGDATYSTRKAAMEQVLLRANTLPVTLLRAGAVHGSGSPIPREWHFVKRALDKRSVRLLPYGGRSRFHPVASSNIAELIRLAARRPGAGPLNAGDPTAPTVAEIAAAIDGACNHVGHDILVDGVPEGGLGSTPWSTPQPIVLDMRKAQRTLNYAPVTDYAGSLPDTVEWLQRVTHGRDWRDIFPILHTAMGPLMFDYEAEDRWLASSRPLQSA